MKQKLLTVKQLAAKLVKTKKAKSINAARISIYNKIRYGLGHEIKDGNIYTSVEWLEIYNKNSKKGRPAKQRKQKEVKNERKQI